MSDPYIPAALRGTSLERSIKALGEVYAWAETAMDRFRLASGISCLPGCGECCKGFEPEIRPAEAAYLAVWLLGPGRDKLGLLDRDDGMGTCPFFDAEDPHHCQVYPARFLICRLFGFCAMRDKEGELDFSLCFALDGSGRHDKRRWRAEDLVWNYGALPPVMADYGAQAAAIEPDGIGKPEKARDALRSAIAKAALAIKMGESVVAEGEEGPEGKSA